MKTKWYDLLPRVGRAIRIVQFIRERVRERRQRKRQQELPFPTKDDAMNEQIASVIRTIIKSAGGGLVGAGVVTNSEMEALAGAAAILVGLAWSWYVKRKAAAAA